MGLTRPFYPHLISFGSQSPTVENVVQISSVTTKNNDTMMIERCASGVVPEYVGIARRDPDVDFQTTQVDDILVACTDSNIARDLSSGTVDIGYRAGKPLGTREPIAGTVHQIARLNQDALLYWTNLRAQDGETAEISCILLTAFNGTDAPLTWLGSQALSGDCLVKGYYKLSRIDINGTVLNGVQEANMETGVQIESIPSDGEAYVGYKGIKTSEPKISITTKNLEQGTQWQGGVSSEAVALTAFNFYLRKCSRTGILVPKATASHIKISATTGLVYHQEASGSPVDAKFMVCLEQPVSGNIFDIAFSQTIP